MGNKIVACQRYSKRLNEKQIVMQGNKTEFDTAHHNAYRKHHYVGEVALKSVKSLLGLKRCLCAPWTIASVCYEIHNFAFRLNMSVSSSLAVCLNLWFNLCLQDSSPCILCSCCCRSKLTSIGAETSNTRSMTSGAAAGVEAWEEVWVRQAWRHQV
ncbi:hypothetical protein FEM48_Zijuj05G0136300 [Ziziphus jujuba var. spinosa]|uniref:Uncharacterized protein n=1 Tax=Ziziphus jujuba var. spinosa TaxID=714518 RepID=A0A978VF54_ZIZJJ|nr:hypothetical protein FEM48_Zijuj05G0136300 [Ziziphus jujuba var. spinosa]